MELKKISITDIENIKIGQAENVEACTGCTVIIAPDGMRAGLDVRGGGPASRESELLKPVANADRIHALVLAGGSAFGLDAAGGVMKYLEERDIGYDVGVTKVPLVCQSDLFDLTIGDPHIRPDAAMAYKACESAPNYRDGNYGAGAGATVGKILGMQYCMKTGIGSYAVQIGELKVGAIVAVNALGDIFDRKTGKQVAGLRTEDGKRLRSSMEVLLAKVQKVENRFTGNTTIGAIITNADLDKTRLCKVASMAHNGYARSICPVHTSADGDSIYALSVGNVAADSDTVGTLAAEVMSEAILSAVYNAQSLAGYPSIHELEG